MRPNKKKSTSSPSRSDLDKAAWQALLSKQEQLKRETVPPGWIDYDKFAEEMGICRESAAEKLRMLARRGLCDRREFRVAWGGTAPGRTATTRLRPYFRLKS
jgi:predicted transcriptional regulator